MPWTGIGYLPGGNQRHGAGGQVAANTVQGLVARQVGVGAAAALVEGRAGGAVGGAGLEGAVGAANGAGDESRGVEAGPGAVGGVAKVKLEPGAEELADRGQRHGAGLAAHAALGVGVKDDVLRGAGGDGEGQGLVAGEEAVDAAVGADLVPDLALHGGAGAVDGLDGVGVLADNVGLDELDVGAVAVAAGVAGVGDFGGGGALVLLELGGRAAGKGLVGRDAAAGGARGRAGGRSGRRGGRRGNRSSRRGRRAAAAGGGGLGDGGRGGGGRRCGRGADDGGDGSDGGLVGGLEGRAALGPGDDLAVNGGGDDHVVALLGLELLVDGAVQVSVAGRVSRDANGGKEEGVCETHIVVSRVLLGVFLVFDL